MVAVACEFSREDGGARSSPKKSRQPRAVAGSTPGQQGVIVKKGRHRRFEEARSLKRSFGGEAVSCAECGAEPEDIHATWCLAEEDSYDRILGEDGRSSVVEHDPLDVEPS